MKKKIADFKRIVLATYADWRYNCKHLNMRNSNNSDMEFATLRMYCHMLDKAMNNPLFEKGHSMQVYNKCVSLKEKLQSIYEKDSAFQWAVSILTRFEEAQRGHLQLKTQCNKVYTSQEMDLYKAFITSRTSCRNFKNEVIPSDVIKDIVRFAIDAPNGCCRQTARFYITQNASKISQLVPCIAGMTNFSNIQAIVAVCAECSYYDLQDRLLQYVDASLATENFMLASRIYNIYGTICNFFHASQKQITQCKNILGIKDTHNIIMFIAIGYPTVIPEKPIRCNIESFYKEV